MLDKTSLAHFPPVVDWSAAKMSSVESFFHVCAPFYSSYDDFKFCAYFLYCAKAKGVEGRVIMPLS